MMMGRDVVIWGEGWEEKKVRIRDRGLEPIQALGLKYELIDMKGVEPSGCAGTDAEMKDEGDMDEFGRSGSGTSSDGSLQGILELRDGDGGGMVLRKDEKVDRRSGAERLLSYQWSIIKEADRERARKICMSAIHSHLRVLIVSFHTSFNPCFLAATFFYSKRSKSIC